MLNLIHDILYRLVGIRKPMEMVDPKAFPLSELRYPRKSLWHYLTPHEAATPLQSEHRLLRNSGLVHIYHRLEVTDPPGNAIYKNQGIQSDIAKYHQKNKKLKRLLHVGDSLSIPETQLVVVNHEYIKSIYYYPKHLLRQAYLTQIQFKSLIQGIVEQLDSDRHQYVILPTPKAMPTMVQLLQYIEHPTNQTLLQFSKPEYFWMTELFRWLHPSTKNNSVWSKIPVDQLVRVNLIMTANDRYVLLNLGYLSTLIKDKDDGALPHETIAADSLTAFLTKTRAVTSSKYHGDRLIKMLATGLINMNKAESQSVNLETPVLNDGIDVDLEQSDEVTERIEQVVEDTLADLTPIPETSEIQSTESVTELWAKKQDSVPDAGAGLKHRLSKATLEGSVSGTKAKQITNAESEWNARLHPILNLPMSEAKVITQEMLAIKPEESQFVQSKGLFDPDMAQSTLAVFDKKYIETVYRRHQVACIDQFKEIGIVPKDYRINIVETIAGKYEVHEVDFVPIEGEPSTIRFKIPYIEPNGTFTYNQTEYMIRKQVADVPIRKIGPSIVALASYYGKLFVKRSDKVVDSILAWLDNSVNKKIATNPPFTPRIIPISAIIGISPTPSAS